MAGEEARGCVAGQGAFPWYRQQEELQRPKQPDPSRLLHELHGVVNGEQRVDVSTRAVDVDVDVAVWVFTFQVNELRTNEVRNGVVDWRTQEDDVLFEKT